MDPFLSVVASAFPGRAGIFDYYSNGQAKPAGCYPNRPAGGTRRGSGNHSTAVEKACSLQITRTEFLISKAAYHKNPTPYN
ncbi:hypothetical protein AtNW77_MTg0322941 (mitochondrion) [Arabidopsis thaliana]